MNDRTAAAKVFVSYAHEAGEPHRSTLRNLVTSLVEDLRRNGLDATFDRDVNGTPAEGWPAWMERRIEEAHFVLVVCTPTYLRRYEGKEAPGLGKGATWEGAIIRQDLYESANHNERFAAILPDRDAESYKPGPLKPHTHYLWPNDRIPLLRWLTQQPGYTPIPIGKVPNLPPDP